MTERPITPTQRPRAVATLGALALAVVLTACSSSDGDESSDASITTDTTAAEAVTEAEPTTGVDTNEPAEDAEPVEDDAPADDEGSSSEGPLDGVLTDVVADAQGGRSLFDGTVDDEADLEALVVDAWGDGDLGLHRGHAQVENVLEAFLGIDHDGMHDLMDEGRNLAATAEAVGQNPEALVQTLTNSYAPFVMEGVDNGVISEDQAAEWIELIRIEFEDRVYWDGVSDS